MSPEETHQIDLACLAEHVLKALGVSAEKPTAEIVVEHAVVQACLELEAVEAVLERHQVASATELGQLVYIVAGIRERLELAHECGEMLATIIANGTQHEIITRLSEAL